MNVFCTIITPDYIPFVKAFRSSLIKYESEYLIFALIVDQGNELPREQLPGVEFLSLADIDQSILAKEIIEKYLYQSSKDEIRWSLKPILITYILNKKSSGVIYVDPDLFFVGDPQFLFDELKTNSVVLSPHWQSIAPSNSNSLFGLLKGGYFNAGFIGVSQTGISAMKWWAEACHLKMEKSEELGLYDDQKYLDILPWEFDNVRVVTHRGCNLACWNIYTNTREIIGGKLVIAKKYEPVFIHFTYDTILRIINGEDKLLLPYLEKYKTAFLDQGLSLDDLMPLIKQNQKAPIIILKHKLLIRTRIKRFLYTIAAKL